MAHDDMHVVMYKILSYLYQCLKDGISPDKDMYSYTTLEINKAYWNEIVSELAHRRLIKGVTVTRSPNGDTIYLENPRITIEGVEFLMENSMMRKAFDFLRETKSAIPFI